MFVPSYLGRDVEAVSLLGVELRGVKDDGDLTLQHHEHHRVLVRAGHALGGVTLDPKVKCLVNTELAIILTMTKLSGYRLT